MPIPWYYMWSDKYRFFHELFINSMKEPEFLPQPIYIEQSYFDRNLYQDEKKHSCNGCNLKVDLLIERLEKTDQQYILFTDIEIIIQKNIYTNLKHHIEQDQTMVFLKEGNNLNIGFILLKVCPEVIEFWKSIKAKIIESPGHDQEYVNDLITGYNGKWACFDEQLFTCSNIYNYSKPFSIMQPLSSSLGKEMDFAEKIFVSAQHLNIEPFMKFVPENIIPYIYKFQELLYLSHKELHSAAIP